MIKAKRGIAYIASHTDAPILPIHIKGTLEAWSKGRSFLFKRLTIVIGKPIPIDDFPDLSSKESQVALVKRVVTNINKLN